ncbi:hypothetical protein AB0J86_09865, partial [Micromonospora sp. NPDC049559]|uniref:hypothetical protein n=1 Tax=Micromonospora sp. NPDC049559 TaxID=3155923 RepID=UPI00344226CD
RTSPTGWVKNRVNVPSATGVVSATWGANGRRYLYTLEGGSVQEIYGSPTGWVKGSVNVPTAADALSATWGVS